MSAYLVVGLTYHDLGWTTAYREHVPAMVAAAGGRYLAHSAAPELIEGEGPVPETLAILEFPSLEAAKGLLDSDAYRPYRDARQAATTCVMYGLEGQ